MEKSTRSADGKRPLSTLSPRTRQLVEQVQDTKQPVIITRHGKSAAVLVDAGEYERQQQRLMLLERIMRGKRDIAEGRTHTQEEVEALMDRWFDGDA